MLQSENVSWQYHLRHVSLVKARHYLEAVESVSRFVGVSEFVGSDDLQMGKLLVLLASGTGEKVVDVVISSPSKLAYICKCCKSYCCKQISLFLYNQLACIAFCPFEVFLIL